MKSKLLATMLLAGTTAFGAVHFSIGIGIGAPYPGYYYAPPPVVAPYAYAPYVAAPAPAPGYIWIAPYYYPVGAGWAWHAGYWARPPYVGARWVAPRYYGRRWYRGYWRR